jgi:predicted O-methyltransferase YrrM
MTQDQWTKVDEYFAERLLPSDPVLEATLAASVAAGLPSISVSPTQGKLLQMLAQIVGATSILEIGTLGGYSTIWLARGLRHGGRIVTLEVDRKHADVALSNFSRAGVQDVVDLRVGNALETLPVLLKEGRGPFDLIFIDADKQNIPAYFEWALKLARVGALIIVDNVVRDGAVIDAQSADDRIHGVRRFVESLRDESASPRSSSTSLTVFSCGRTSTIESSPTSSISRRRSRARSPAPCRRLRAGSLR